MYNKTSGPAHGVDAIDSANFFDYDANGNLTRAQETDGIRDYDYDTQNRLKSVAKAGVTLAAFTYDDSGERTLKTAGGKTRHFIYPFHEQEGSDETDYVYLNGLRVAAVENGALRYIHGDHLGSTQVVSNTSGASVATARYEPFGEFSSTTPPTKSGNFYTGQYFDNADCKHKCDK